MLLPGCTLALQRVQKRGLARISNNLPALLKGGSSWLNLEAVHPVQGLMPNRERESIKHPSCGGSEL